MQFINYVLFYFKVEPVKDSSLKVAWYHNGLPLTSGSRIRASHEFGLVTLDIDDIGARDQVGLNPVLETKTLNICNFVKCYF